MTRIRKNTRCEVPDCDKKPVKLVARGDWFDLLVAGFPPRLMTPTSLKVRRMVLPIACLDHLRGFIASILTSTFVIDTYTGTDGKTIDFRQLPPAPKPRGPAG